MSDVQSICTVTSFRDLYRHVCGSYEQRTQRSERNGPGSTASCMVPSAKVEEPRPEAKTSTFEVPTDQNTTKIPREDPQREEKRHQKIPRERKTWTWGREKEKKCEILGGPAEGGPGRRAVQGGGGQRHGRGGPLAKIGLARPKSAQIGQVKGCGQSRPGRGQSRPGQSRSWPNKVGHDQSRSWPSSWPK